MRDHLPEYLKKNTATNSLVKFSLFKPTMVKEKPSNNLFLLDKMLYEKYNTEWH